MPSAAGSGVGFLGLTIAGLAVLVNFSLHKIEEGLPFNLSTGTVLKYCGLLITLIHLQASSVDTSMQVSG